MRFLIDESTDEQVGHRLEAEGHDVRYIAADLPSIDDGDVLTYSNELEAILVAAMEFGDLISMGFDGPALVSCWSPGITPEERAKRVAGVVGEFLHSLVGAYTTMDLSKRHHRFPDRPSRRTPIRGSSGFPEGLRSAGRLGSMVRCTHGRCELGRDTSSDPNVLAGKPVFKGTRISVELLIDLLAEGWDEGESRGRLPGP
ncbi:MAG: DUF5615 family PIN-like protein [Dehalococcoidia bacterium]|nr:DUF5615 family PIN-like protein [Dehalococcoidia bacterium]